MPRILIVEDEPAISFGLELDLKTDGYDIEIVEDGESASRRGREGGFDLIVLDVMLPKKDGFEVCRELRRAGIKTPVLMLTAKSQEAEKVMGLDLGADDYLTKPFSPRELVLRVKSLLRRSQPGEEPAEQIRAGSLLLDIPRHVVRLNNKVIALTATEFKLLTVLVQRRGRVQSREQLLREVWGYDTPIETRTVDTHMRRLREKLGSAAKYLDTLRGVGYRFVDE
jgi:two-component system phosphate regulon response regulator PhoB